MNKDCPKHLEESKRQLKTTGLKVTGARLGLLDIFKHAQRPLSIKEISGQLRAASADTATLYRNVQALAGLGLVKEIRLKSRQAYFELAGEHHHHLVCERCGKVSDIEMCDIKLPPATVRQAGFAKVSRHALEFFGLCRACAGK